MTSAIDPTVPVYKTPTTASVRQNFQTAHDEITALQNATAGAPFLRLSGGTLTGLLTLAGDPSGLLDAATKNYVDNKVAGGSGGGSGVPEAPIDTNTYGRSNTTWVPVLPIAGGVLTGALNVQANLQANELVLSSPPGASLGVGTLNMPGLLRINANAVTTAAPLAGTLLHIVQADGQTPRLSIDCYGAAQPGTINFRAAGGTGATPTTTQAAAGLGYINFSGYIAGAFTGARAYISSNATDTYTAGAQGTNLVFATTPAGTTAVVFPMALQNGVVIGNPAGGDPGLGALRAANFIEINRNAAALPAVGASTPLHIGGADGEQCNITYEGFVASPWFTFRFANTSAAAPSTVLNGNWLGAVRFVGYTAGLYQNPRAMILAQASQDWTSGGQGCLLQFYATPLNSNTTTAIMSLYPGATSQGWLTINGNAAQPIAPPQPGTMLQLLAPDTLQTRMVIDCFGTGTPSINFRYAQGTGAAPTPVTSANQIGFIGFNGYAAGGFTSARATILAISTENWTGTAQGSALWFSTTPAGGTSTGMAMSLAGGGLGGMQVGSPTGADKGLGTINANTVYANGVALTSDARFKRAIEPLDLDALALVEEIEPKRFKYNMPPLLEPIMTADGPVEVLQPPEDWFERTWWGFIASEVDDVTAGYERSIVLTDNQGIQSVSLGDLVAVLWQAVRQLKAELDETKMVH